MSVKSSLASRQKFLQSTESRFVNVVLFNRLKDSQFIFGKALKNHLRLPSKVWLVPLHCSRFFMQKKCSIKIVGQVNNG